MDVPGDHLPCHSQNCRLAAASAESPKEGGGFRAMAGSHPMYVMEIGTFETVTALLASYTDRPVYEVVSVLACLGDIELSGVKTWVLTVPGTPLSSQRTYTSFLDLLCLFLIGKISIYWYPRDLEREAPRLLQHLQEKR
ncbi:Prolactin-releasing peptide [Manis javanica]|nr:Prolactin-releasing peptide [Manis javanica]